MRTLFFRKLQERAVRYLSWLVLAISLGGMFWILTSLVLRGAEAISWEFLTMPSRPYGLEDAGIANALLGTFLITGMAAVLAIPVGIAGGIYLAEFGKTSRFASVVRFSANMMMGIPSIVTGLFVYACYVIPTGHFSGFAGSLALALIMYPVVLRTTEDMLSMVPDTQREAALALGLTRSRTTLAIVCRCARSGLATGILMALARVSGETAPLLFTALWSDSWPTSFFTSPTPNVPVLMTEYTTNSPFAAMHTAGWGAALVVMAFILALNIIVRVCLRKRT